MSLSRTLTLSRTCDPFSHSNDTVILGQLDPELPEMKVLGGEGNDRFVVTENTTGRFILDDAEEWDALEIRSLVGNKQLEQRKLTYAVSH